MAKTHFYTKREDQIIIDHLKENPTNLKNGLNLAAKKLGRSPRAVHQRYYKKIRGSEHILTIFVDKKKSPMNTKNEKKSIVSASCKNIILMTALNSVSKDKAIEFLLENMSIEDKSQLIIKLIK